MSPKSQGPPCASLSAGLAATGNSRFCQRALAMSRECAYHGNLLHCTRATRSAGDRSVSTMMLFAQATTDTAPMELAVRLPLSVMTFLEFAVWGAWYVVLGNYLNTIGFSRKEIGRV